ncbi:FAD-dependent oxidoreductase [uncultured Bifidobacterium sp.]|uniref:FAD-dependent oxidoreductase n=1 Tax=uncultured Bifidobacterium sp. TaxID=165187 RepID=UPI002604632E|nr:FAD-dependent oxidoreductase [uncultured Bifidobacterium sp.]
MAVTYDVAVIGAGPGGYSTALRAAELGLSVALVERDPVVGGTCLNRGCIPSKALITATHAIGTVRHAQELGINASVDGIDFGKLRSYRLGIVDTMTKGLAGLLAHRHVHVFHGEAEARGEGLVRVTPAEGEEFVERFDNAQTPENAGPCVDIVATHIVLATGSSPRPLPGIPFSGALIDSTQALSLDRFPSSVVIIGSGPIAIEFASMWNEAGSSVTLLIRHDRVLSSWDRRTSSTITRELRRQGITVIAHSHVTAVDTGVNLGATVRYTLDEGHGDDHVTDGTNEGNAYGEYVLAAIGRTPNTDMPWLDALGIQRDSDGYVLTDEMGRTNVAGILAVGDITHGPALAHRAFAQGITAAECAAGIPATAVDDDAIPLVVFSSPEAASVGMTKVQAEQRQGVSDVEESVYPMMANARMLMSGSAGSLSIVSGIRAGESGQRVVLGVHMVSPLAGDLIAEAQQLVGQHAALHSASSLIHPHPTMSETLGEALLKADGRPLHTR